MAVSFTDPRLSAIDLNFGCVADDPIGDALELLRHWHRVGGVHLERRHVEAAARMTGARFELLWDVILSNCPRKY